MAEKYGNKVRELMVKETKEVFTSNKGFMLSSIDKIKASDLDGLRKSLRKSGSSYMVLKNRLARIALEEAGMSEMTDQVKEKQILGIGLIKEDPVQIAKLMVEFSKKNKGFDVKGGYLEGRVLTAEKVKELSELPSREQLIAMVVGMIKSPLNGFAGVLSSLLRSILYALNAIKDKKEGE
jgi:large subunit ribosomal protein L10